MIVRFIVEALSDIAIVKQVVHDPEGIIAQFLGYRPQGQDMLRICYAPVIGNGHTKFHSSSRAWLPNVCKQTLFSLVAAHGTTLAQRKRTLVAGPRCGEVCYHRLLTTRLQKGDRLWLPSRPLRADYDSRRGLSQCRTALSSLWRLSVKR